MASNNILGTIYDIFSQSISVLDVATDIIVCVEFYQHGSTVFFSISLSILLLAVLAYDMAFVIKYGDEYNFHNLIALFITLIPISPFIPFIFYFCDDENSKIAIFFRDHWCYDLSFRKYNSTVDDATRFKKFFDSKISKHLGFILESLVEAFPQAILQMTFIVFYKETNVVSIISILISLLSVSTKSFVFSMGTASNIKQLIFNWLSAVTDFFSIFFVVSWVFYLPQQLELQEAFLWFRSIYFYKLYIFIFPAVGFTSVLMLFAITWTIAAELNASLSCKFCAVLPIFIATSVMWICGVIASVLIAEVTTWTWIAGTFLFLGTKRFPTMHRLSLEFWFSMLQWIKSSKAHRVGTNKTYTSFTKQQDKMMRIASVNYITLQQTADRASSDTDTMLVTYLEAQRIGNQYMDVSMKGLRENASDKNNAYFTYKFWTWYSSIWHDDVWKFMTRDWDNYQQNRSMDNLNEVFISLLAVLCIGPLTFVFGPFYFISRCITLFFAGFIVAYLYVEYDVNVWNTQFIDVFQVVMMSIYLCLCAALSILFYFNITEQYLMAHLLPSSDLIIGVIKNDGIMEDIMQQITNHYYTVTVIPIRRAIVIEWFGPDIGQIIVSYLPTDDDFKVSNDVVRVKTVV